MVGESRMKWLLLIGMLAAGITGSFMVCGSPPNAAPATPTLESHSSVSPAPSPESSPISEEATFPDQLRLYLSKRSTLSCNSRNGTTSWAKTPIYSVCQRWTLTDLDEGKNRIEVGVACESDRDMVREELQKRLTSLGVPLDAVIFTVRPRAYPLIMPPVFECVPSEVIDPATGLSTPGFGGLYVDSGIAYVYLLEPSQEKAEELVLTQFGSESFEGIQEVRALKGLYTWTQLTEWYESIKDDIRGIPATGVVSVDRHKNRLTIEVRTEHEGNTESQIKDVLSRNGVPYRGGHSIDPLIDASSQVIFSRRYASSRKGRPLRSVSFLHGFTDSSTMDSTGRRATAAAQFLLQYNWAEVVGDRGLEPLTFCV